MRKREQERKYAFLSFIIVIKAFTIKNMEEGKKWNSKCLSILLILMMMMKSNHTGNLCHSPPQSDHDSQTNCQVVVRSQLDQRGKCCQTFQANFTNKDNLLSSLSFRLFFPHPRIRPRSMRLYHLMICSVSSLTMRPLKMWSVSTGWMIKKGKTKVELALGLVRTHVPSLDPIISHYVHNLLFPPLR